LNSPDPKRPDPDEFLLARADKLLSELEDDTPRPASDPVTRMTTVRPAAVNDDLPVLDKRAVRGFAGLLLAAACIGVAAIAWQSFYAYKAKQPQPVPFASPEQPAQPSPAAVKTDVAKAAPPQPAAPPPALLAQAGPKDAAPSTGALPPDLAQMFQKADTTKQAPPQPAAPARAAPEDAAPAAAAPPAESAQLLQTMARELASLGQGIEQLKAGQEQMVRDNAKMAEQLRASQEQMARVIARASEQNPRASAPRAPKLVH
jgi:hypothetical protein